jgi:hypothetical protein
MIGSRHCREDKLAARSDRFDANSSRQLGRGSRLSIRARLDRPGRRVGCCCCRMGGCALGPRSVASSPPTTPALRLIPRLPLRALPTLP